MRQCNGSGKKVTDFFTFAEVVACQIESFVHCFVSNDILVDMYCEFVEISKNLQLFC